MKHVICPQLSNAALAYVEHKDHEPQLAEIYAREYNRQIDYWEQEHKKSNDNTGETND